MKLNLVIIFGFIINIATSGLINDAINLTQATYCIDKEWDCKTCDKSKELTKIISKYGEKVIIGMDRMKNYGFIAFRGSSNLENWIDNIQFEKTCINNICIETGFFKLYKDLRSKIIKNLPNTHKLLITGHSLGAAEATLLASDLCKSKKIDLITFGSPRVGNKKFVNYYKNCNINSIRVTHYYDMIPHLPQENLGYEHIPGEIWYNKINSEYKICEDENKEDDSCSNSCYPLSCTSIEDHLNYMNISLGSNGDC